MINKILNEKYPFKLKDLDYDYNSLEPYIDKETMYYHHDKHLNSYIDNLNNILLKNPDFQKFTLGELIKNNIILPENIRQGVKNNAGGIFNHNFYFKIMTPEKEKNNIKNFDNIILKNFNSMEEFLNKFIDMALNRFASGWTWLTLDANKNLYIISTPYHDTPYSTNLLPIMLVDVWEHAYYLKYQNRRNLYLENFLNVINWKQVNTNYENYIFPCK